MPTILVVLVCKQNFDDSICSLWEFDRNNCNFTILLLCKIMFTRTRKQRYWLLLISIAGEQLTKADVEPIGGVRTRSAA